MFVSSVGLHTDCFASLQDCPFVSQADLQSAPILPGGSPYMLIANLDKSIANCLTWDLYRQGKLSRFLVVRSRNFV